MLRCNDCDWYVTCCIAWKLCLCVSAHKENVTKHKTSRFEDLGRLKEGGYLIAPGGSLIAVGGVYCED